MLLSGGLIVLIKILLFFYFVKKLLKFWKELIKLAHFCYDDYKLVGKFDLDYILNYGLVINEIIYIEKSLLNFFNIVINIIIIMYIFGITIDEMMQYNIIYIINILIKINNKYIIGEEKRIKKIDTYLSYPYIYIVYLLIYFFFGEY